MVLQDLLAGGVEYVQDSQPSNADAGEIWLDTSVDPSALKIYDASSDVWDEAQASNLDAPVSNIQDELQEGRTRELLMLLQDKPVPEVVDPLNIQSGLSSAYSQNGSDYELITSRIIDDFESGDFVVENSDWSDWTTEGNVQIRTDTVISGTYSAESESQSGTTANLNTTRTSAYEMNAISASIIIGSDTGDANMDDGIRFEYKNGTDGEVNVQFYDGSNDIKANNQIVAENFWSPNEVYIVTVDFDWSNNTFDLIINGQELSTDIDLKSGNTGIDDIFIRNYTFGTGSTRSVYVDDVYASKSPGKSGYVTDRFSAPTSAPAGFKAWNAIQARDVITGGSTSTEPVEFDISDSEGTVLNIDGVSRDNDSNSAVQSGKQGLVINPNEPIDFLMLQISSNTSNVSTAYVRQTDGTEIAQAKITGSVAMFFGLGLSAGTDYYVQVDNNGNDWTRGYDSDPNFPYTGNKLDLISSVAFTSENSSNAFAIKEISTKNTRIPKTRIADEPFTMRNRVYSEDAGSDGQSDYQIATTGDGGHFGIPILTVVSVKKNGSVLDSANWSFDGDSMVTIDTSNVSIASGDEIDIKYDFDVFDSTLQPRAYLNRESTSETSPSISHFRYEYVI